jgi:2-octaprenyl-6-methoxyphenol hydroxylase
MHYDLIIIGGGLVGRSLACALGSTPLKIALIDASEQEQPDPRLIALNYGSGCFLESLGLWPQLQALSAPIHEVHVSHRGRFGATRLNSQNAQLPSLGSVLRAQDLNQVLGDTLAKAEREGRFTELRPARVKALALQEKNTVLTLEQRGEDRQVTGDLIIAADGTHSTIRRLLSFDTQTVDYQQSAIVTTTRLGRSHENRAFERFLDEGALAMLPLKDEESGDRLCATIWTAGTPTISALQNLDDTAFLQALQTQFGYRLGRLKGISRRHVFPLQLIRVKNPLQGNVLLIGNAAHTIHPIAAQGLNLALYEIAQLSRLLLNNLSENLPLSARLADHLGRFQPKTNLLFSHYLSQIFASDFWGSNIARQLGMVGLDLCPPIKKQFGRLMAMENRQWLTS